MNWSDSERHKEQGETGEIKMNIFTQARTNWFYYIAQRIKNSNEEFRGYKGSK